MKRIEVYPWKDEEVLVRLNNRGCILSLEEAKKLREGISDAIRHAGHRDSLRINIERYSSLLSKEYREALSEDEQAEVAKLKKDLHERLGSYDTELQRVVCLKVSVAMEKYMEELREKPWPDTPASFEIRRQLREMFKDIA